MRMHGRHIFQDTCRNTHIHPESERERAKGDEGSHVERTARVCFHLSENVLIKEGEWNWFEIW